MSTLTCTKLGRITKLHQQRGEPFHTLFTCRCVFHHTTSTACADPLTFPHEGGDGLIKNRCRDAGVVGHRVFLHALKRRELHNSADHLIGEGQVQIPHDALHFMPRVLWAQQVTLVQTLSLFSQTKHWIIGRAQHAFVAIKCIKLPPSCPHRRCKGCSSFPFPPSNLSHDHTRSPKLLWRLKQNKL